MIAATLAVIGVLYAFWLLFVLVMSFKANWANMAPVARVLAVPPAVLGWLVDVAINYLASLCFWELPATRWPLWRTETLSQRMGRYLALSGARRVIARGLCRNLLDAFQQGGHCR